MGNLICLKCIAPVPAYTTAMEGGSAENAGAFFSHCILQIKKAQLKGGMLRLKKFHQRRMEESDD